MSNYTQSTNFATKDALPSGDPLKIVKGTEINTEFVNIAVAIATKADLASPTFSGNVTGTFVGNVTGNVTGSAGTVTTITTTQVLNATAGASANAVGTYAFLCQNTYYTTATISAGTTYAGSSLDFAAVLMDSTLFVTLSANATPSPLGTWRAMGSSPSTTGGVRATLFLRIS
jgi:hypothetical protein